MTGAELVHYFTGEWPPFGDRDELDWMEGVVLSRKTSVGTDLESLCRAAHEVGHWQQDRENRWWWVMRKDLVWMFWVVSVLGCALALGGVWLDSRWGWAGLGVAVLSSLLRKWLVVWVERDASARAEALLMHCGIFEGNAMRLVCARSILDKLRHSYTLA